MNINNSFRYLNIGLPEDILRLKMNGDFKEAIRLMDLRLAEKIFLLPFAAVLPYRKKSAAVCLWTILTQKRRLWLWQKPIFRIFPRRNLTDIQMKELSDGFI